MSASRAQQMASFSGPGQEEADRRTALLEKEVLVARLKAMRSQSSLAQLKARAAVLKEAVTIPQSSDETLAASQPSDTAISLRRDVLCSELDQVLRARTLERAKYYVTRLEREVQRARTNSVNDINLLRWKEYDDVITDSLWVLDRRDTSGAHMGWYWGNFVPQIPHQMMLRYTRKGDWVLDPFLGSGTTLIECRKLGRNGIGVELSGEVAHQAESWINREPNRHRVATQVLAGDSRTLDLKPILKQRRISAVQLLIMHPPYHNIIKFSDDDRDLSNARDTEAFLSMFGEVVDATTPHLERGRYLVLVIGDKYAKGEWIPLGFWCMNEALKRGFLLKSIVVKNFEDTRGKRDQKELWRYRALVGGFYVFKHEYVMVFRKR